MHVERLPPEHFATIPETPLELKPFDPESKRLALEYERTLNRLLGPFNVTAQLFGSTDLELLGKGEWEFALFLEDSKWYPTLTFLVNHFRGVYVLDEAFTLFQDQIGGYEIELVAMRGEVALRNQTIMRYWHENSAARATYEAGKIEHAYSKRAYYRWKDEFIAGILENL